MRDLSDGSGTRGSGGADACQMPRGAAPPVCSADNADCCVEAGSGRVREQGVVFSGQMPKFNVIAHASPSISVALGPWKDVICVDRSAMDGAGSTRMSCFSHPFPPARSRSYIPFFFSLVWVSLGSQTKTRRRISILRCSHAHTIHRTFSTRLVEVAVSRPWDQSFER